MTRHPLIQITIDLIAIVLWVALAVGIPTSAAWAVLVLVFLR